MYRENTKNYRSSLVDQSNNLFQQDEKKSDTEKSVSLGKNLTVHEKFNQERKQTIRMSKVRI